MQSHMVTKYEFRIRTRDGTLVEGLSICSDDEEGARRRLAQMYRGCEILESRSVKANLTGRSSHLVSYEEVVEMITAGASVGNTGFKHPSPLDRQGNQR